jgi:hypothetical protein
MATAKKVKKTQASKNGQAKPTPLSIFESDLEIAKAGVVQRMQWLSQNDPQLVKLITIQNNAEHTLKVLRGETEAGFINVTKEGE